MNEYIAELLNLFSFDQIINRDWLDIALIVAPSVILILALLGYLFFVKSKKWRITVYATCLALTLTILPYELLRQSAEMSRADANVDEIQDGLKELLTTANLEHISGITNKAVATEILDEMIQGLGQEKKKDLILISWLMAENDRMSLNQFENKQESLANDIKLSLSDTKSEIIDSRTPVEKISDDIVTRLDSDVNYLIENKMQSFKHEINHSLDTFQQGINSFIQTELNSYEEKLSAITEKNTEELRGYAQKAEQAFSQQVNKTNKDSIQRLDDTKLSIESINTAIRKINLDNVMQQVKQLSNSVEDSQRKSSIMFEYNECLRSITLFDLTGKKEQCREAFSEKMASL